MGAVAGIFNRIFKRKRILDMEPEAQRLKQFISTASRHDTAASILAFGLSLGICRDRLEDRKPANFLQVFSEEYPLAFDKLKPFAGKLRNNLNSSEQERLLKEIAANIL